jgi:hypothetical protein
VCRLYQRPAHHLDQSVHDRNVEQHQPGSDSHGDEEPDAITVAAEEAEDQDDERRQ